MNASTLPLFLGLFAVWGVLVALKAINAVRSGQAYTFSMWDGGLLRAGKRLTPLGAKLKAISGGTIGLGCIVMLGRVAPLQPTIYVLMAAAIGGIVADLALTASD